VIVIVREDLLGRARKETPAHRLQDEAANDSMWNTPDPVVVRRGTRVRVAARAGLAAIAR
jgi:phosphoserine aminotransferase